MSNLSQTLNSLMKKYIEDDMVKNVFRDKNVIQFEVDLIDREIQVTINIKSENNQIYEVQYEKTHRIIKSTSFKDFLCNLLEKFVKERDKNIEFYNQDETPTPSQELKDEEMFDIDDDDDDEEEEGEDGDEVVVEVDKEDNWNLEEDDDITNMMMLREPPYQILIPQKLNELQNESIKKITERLFINEAGAKIILRGYGWDVEKIMNCFTRHGKEKVLSEVGLSQEKVKETVHNKNSKFTCVTCFDDVKYKKTTCLKSCGHRFCNICWKKHITIKIKDGSSKRIRCMMHKCNCVIDESIVSKFISGRIKSKYDNKVMDSFVEDNSKIKWCSSSPHCGNAVSVKVSSKSPLEILCLCKHEFCFNCLESPHLPASCIMIKFWKKKCADDSETLNWINSNTRDCPKCNKATEKNGGCNHITCKCGEQDENTQTSSRESLKRYLHYYNHYNAHLTSFKNQKQMKKKIDQKVRKMYKSKPNSAWVEIEWLRNGMEVLFAARRALMNSYVFAFYLFDKSKNKKALVGCRKFIPKQRVSNKNIFENLQEQLESNTEKLNKFLDLPLTKMLTGDDVKNNIMSYSVLSEKRMHGLYDVVRKDMINEGEFILPSPQYIVTNQSYDKGNYGKSKNKENVIYNNNSPKVRGDQEDVMLEQAIMASLRQSGGNNQMVDENQTEEDLELQKALYESMQFQ